MRRLLHLLLLVLFIAAAFAAGRPFQDVAPEAGVFVTVLALAALLPAVFVRRHFWAVAFGSAIVLAGGYALYVVVLPPRGGSRVAVSKGGDWLAVVRDTPHRYGYKRLTLINARDASAVNVTGYCTKTSRIVESRDGRHLFFIRFDGERGTLAHVSGHIVESLMANEGPLGVASADGSRVITGETTLQVINVPARRVMTTFPRGTATDPNIWFTSDDHLRLLAWAESTLWLRSLDLRTGAEQVHTIWKGEGTTIARASHSESGRIVSLLLAAPRRALLLFDENGRLLRDEPLPGFQERFWRHGFESQLAPAEDLQALFPTIASTQDDRVAVALAKNWHAFVRVFGPDGAPRGDIPLRDLANLSTEPQPGIVVAGPQLELHSAQIVDLGRRLASYASEKPEICMRETLALPRRCPASEWVYGGAELVEYRKDRVLVRFDDP